MHRSPSLKQLWGLLRNFGITYWCGISSTHNPKTVQAENHHSRRCSGLCSTCALLGGYDTAMHAWYYASTNHASSRTGYNIVRPQLPSIYHHKTLTNCGAPFWCSGKILGLFKSYKYVSGVERSMLQQSVTPRASFGLIESTSLSVPLRRCPAGQGSSARHRNMGKQHKVSCSAGIEIFVLKKNQAIAKSPSSYLTLNGNISNHGAISTAGYSITN